MLLEEENLKLKSLVIENNKKIEELNLTASAYKENLEIEKDILSSKLAEEIQAQELNYYQKIEQEKLEYNKKIEQEKLAYNKKIEQQALKYKNKNNEQKIVIDEQEKTIIDQKDIITVKDLNIAEITATNKILNEKLADLEIENKQLDKLISDNKLNENDLNIIKEFKEENLLLEKEISILKNQILSSNEISKNLDIEMQKLNEDLLNANQSNNDLSSEIALLDNKIKQYEEVKIASEEGDFFQKALNLLGFGDNQEIEIEQLKVNNETLTKKNSELKLKLEEVSLNNTQISKDSSELVIEVKKIKDGFDKTQTENKKLLLEKKEIAENLKITELNMKDASLKIASQTNEIDILQEQIKKINTADLNPSLQNKFEENSRVVLATTNNRVNLREFPKIPSKVKYIINKDTILKVINENNDWVEVLTESNVKGFIYKTYINFETSQDLSKTKDTTSDNKNSSQSSSDNNSKSELHLTVQVYSNLKSGSKLSVKSDANIRVSANSSSKVVNIIEKGEIVFFDSFLKGWVKVITATQDIGYIDSSYLHIVN